jgi:hypothetical protein
MSLNPQFKRDLQRELSRHYPVVQNAVAMLDLAQIDTSKLHANNVTATALWIEAVNYAEETVQIGEILTQALTDFPASPELLRLRKDFDNGVDTRITTLAKAIQQKQCILFLGPGMLNIRSGAQTTPFTRSLSRDLSNELARNKIYFDESLREEVRYVSQRLQTNPLYVKGDLGVKAQKFFAANQAIVDRQPYRDLTELPFPLVINTNPDSIFYDLMNTKVPSAGVDFDFYNQSNSGSPINEFEEPDTVTPMPQCFVYNIFGSFKNPHSILFTEADYVSFVKNILQRSPGLHKNVIRQFDDTKYYLFLGFEFSAWHLKILFEALSIVKLEDRSISIYIDNPLPHHELEYFDKEYKFYFFNTNIVNFTNALLTKYRTL